MLRIVHELEEVCYRIACHTAAPGSYGDEIVAIFEDLHVMAFRGIVISVAGLAYHGLGLDPGCPRDKALALMRHLRDKGPLTRRDIQRSVQGMNRPHGLQVDRGHGLHI